MEFFINVIKTYLLMLTYTIAVTSAQLHTDSKRVGLFLS